MAATRKAQKDAELSRISQIGDFKKRIGGIFELPSGLVVKLRNPGGLSAFLDSENIPNALLAIVQKALKTGQKVDPEEFLSDDGIDAEMLKSVTFMFDAVAIKAMVEPRVHPAPETEDDRRDDMLYVDELPQDDKQFIFNWVTSGVKDLEPFRNQSESDVASVSAIGNVRSTSKSLHGTDAG